MLTDKILKSSPNSKIIISVCTVTLVAMGAYNWVVSPYTSYLQASQRYERTMSDTGKKLTVIKKKNKIKQARLEELQRQMAEIKSGFFTAEKARRLFGALEPVALQYGCKLESLSYMSDRDKRRRHKTDRRHRFRAQSAALLLSGRYEDITEFLTRLTGYPQHVYIRGLSIESDRPGSADLSCEIIITIYLIEDKETITNE